ncbi:hypothetical protein PM082_022483 [Marasmius tenuissimus]|nr:hypothetical protein PM082_022483 [Marasmius tenuissimus]
MTNNPLRWRSRQQARGPVAKALGVGSGVAAAISVGCGWRAAAIGFGVVSGLLTVGAALLSQERSCDEDIEQVARRGSEPNEEEHIELELVTQATSSSRQSPERQANASNEPETRENETQPTDVGVVNLGISEGSNQGSHTNDGSEPEKVDIGITVLSNHGGIDLVDNTNSQELFKDETQSIGIGGVSLGTAEGLIQPLDEMSSQELALETFQDEQEGQSTPATSIFTDLRRRLTDHTSTSLYWHQYYNSPGNMPPSPDSSRQTGSPIISHSSAVRRRLPKLYFCGMPGCSECFTTEANFAYYVRAHVNVALTFKFGGEKGFKRIISNLQISGDFPFT